MANNNFSKNPYATFKEVIGVLVLMGLFFLMGKATAQEKEPNQIGTVSKIQAETVILKAKVARATAQAELDSKSRKPNTPVNTDALPMVSKVIGAGPGVTATFLYPGNISFDGRVGDVLAGGYKVEQIAIDRVNVTDAKGKRITLPFGTVYPQTYQQAK